MINIHRLAICYLTFLGLLIFFSPLKLFAATLAVGPSGYSYTTIQSAIDDASTDDTVLVHAGSHIENIDFNGKTVPLHKTARLLPLSMATPKVVRSISRIVRLRLPTAILLEIIPLPTGAASVCIKRPIPSADCVPTILNSTISENTANHSGGGIACDLYSRPVIRSCIIEGNSAASGGGGVFNNNSSPKLTNCIIGLRW